MRRIVSHSELEFRQALKEAESAGEDITIELDPGTAYRTGEETLLLTGGGGNKLVIEGNGARLIGNGSGKALTVHRSHVLIRNLHIGSYFVGVWIEADQKDISEIGVKGCVFEDIVSEGVATAITASGLGISDIQVEENTFIAPSKERGGHCSTAINFMTACFETDHQPIHHVALRNVRCKRNELKPNPQDKNVFMLGITVHGVCDYAFYDDGDMLRSPYNDVSDSLEEMICIEDNVIEGVWDIGIDVLAGLPAIRNCILRNVEIRNNHITYHNTAINVGTANIPSSGNVRNCETSAVTISGNTLIPQVPGPHEPQIGIMLFTVRAESRTIVCRDLRMHDIYVINNHIYGREVGIALQAIHATQDLPFPSVVEHCSLKRVTIAGNKIENAQLPVRIFAAHLEGRYDPFWGFDLAPFDKKLPFSTWCTNGLIDDVFLSDNEIYEYDTAFTIGAAWACGHAAVKDCTVGENVNAVRNKLDKRRKVFSYYKRVADNDMYEDAIGMNNCVLCDLKNEE
ncbi:MAG: hypothetical protein HFI29_13450 [Lachnospiraceae bacterium]|jgi:hypothetical protein|nr:hypothetical protein [Lachnospiraceae bacterium]